MFALFGIGIFSGTAAAAFNRHFFSEKQTHRKEQQSQR
jgi:hypothetical protein